MHTPGNSKAYKPLNASQWLLDMHASFLKDRSMVVKIGTCCSSPIAITGGAVQGSVLGVLDHNAVLESLDDEVLNIYIAKYIDDITLVESVPKAIPWVDDGDHHLIHPPATQAAFNEIVRRANEKSMKINASKTQVLTISSTSVPARAYLDTESGIVPPNTSLKMLGFEFDERPTVHKQIDALIKKANKRTSLCSLTLSGMESVKIS